ncbi:MAG TPA: class I SAM-dependent methyltransferase [Candidatus Dormibacteraeota bacterium]|nr:class I SAM-dependent methyltransferase [Candidatus Dormibacteraeota bacterium]
MDRVFAALYDRLLAPSERGWLGEQRRRLVGRASGEVLEIGGGTGANLVHYGPVQRLVVTEPAEPMRRQLERRARSLGRAVVMDGAPAERLPFPDASVDTVVSTLVLCTVSNPATALLEIGRVLRPGGRLLFLEHVRGEGRRGRVQERVTPVWRRLAGGCHLDRDTVSAIRRQGFEVRGLTSLQPRGALATVLRPVVVGVAVRP